MKAKDIDELLSYKGENKITTDNSKVNYNALEMIENLKCCGNCVNVNLYAVYGGTRCELTNDPTGADFYCDNWSWDAMTKDERK